MLERACRRRRSTASRRREDAGPQQSVRRARPCDPGLGKVVKQNANVGVAAGINSLGSEADSKARRRAHFPLRFVDGAVFLGPCAWG
jgi:hypothetical protein